MRGGRPCGVGVPGYGTGVSEDTPARPAIDGTMPHSFTPQGREKAATGAAAAPELPGRQSRITVFCSDGQSVARGFRICPFPCACFRFWAVVIACPRSSEPTSSHRPPIRQAPQAWNPPGEAPRGRARVWWPRCGKLRSAPDRPRRSGRRHADKRTEAQRGGHSWQSGAGIPPTGLYVSDQTSAVESERR